VKLVCEICGDELSDDHCSEHCDMRAKWLQSLSKKLKSATLSLPTINQLLILLALIVGANCYAQRGTGANPLTQDSGLKPQASLFALAPAPFKQTMLTWDNPPGASNIVSWGTVRNYWTNGSRTITTNTFPVTNGTAYKITAMVSGLESIPALWPSNRYDRVWVQTSTNLSNWADALIWQTNFNKPQEYLRLRSELIRWE